jgi:hypothetical protein
MIETTAIIGITGMNFIGIAALYYRLGKIEAKFKSLPCYKNKEFAALALRRNLCK